MIRTTISCCALFGCLLWGAQTLRHPPREPLRPVESPPVLRPVDPSATEAHRIPDAGLVKASATESPREEVSVALALNEPRTTTDSGPARSVTTESRSAGTAAVPEAVDEDELFGLLLEPALPEAAGDETQDESPLDNESLDNESLDNGPLDNGPLDKGPARTVLPGRDDSAVQIRRGNVVRFAPRGGSMAGRARDVEAEDFGPGGRPGVEQRFSDQLLELRDEIRSCLAYYQRRPEDVQMRSPWGVMHALIAFGVDTEVLVGGRPVNAIGWLCWNQPCRGQRLFTLRNNQLATVNGPGVQGHEGQFLAMLAQSRVARDYEIRVGDRRFTIDDLIAYEQRTCVPNSELTFKLIGLVHYLDSDATWTSEQGAQWSIPRLIQEELRQPVIGAACGGTHRMMGFSYAVRNREQRGEPFDGQWLRAKKFVDAYHEYALKLQNPDGSFSTNWFRGRGSSPDLQRRVQTTGHILEWLVYSLPEEQLQDPRVVRAVQYLTRLMLQQREWEIGPRGHALHALVLYEQRVFGDTPAGSRRLAELPPVVKFDEITPDDVHSGEGKSGEVELSLEQRPTLRFHPSPTATRRSGGWFNLGQGRSR